MVDWRLIGVFDHEGLGRDFCYTNGIFEGHALPELHLWARPTHGEDPGDGFSLSQGDMGGILNMIAERYVNRELTVGDTFTHLVDAGDTTLTFELGAPVDRDDVEAYQTNPSALVVPVRWSLQRVPEGVDRDVKRPVRRRILETAAGIVEELENLDPQGRDVAQDTGVEAKYGPWTPVVEAALERVSLLDADELWALAIHGMLSGRVGAPRPYVLGKLASSARRAGRRRALDAALEGVRDAVRIAVEAARERGELDFDEAAGVTHSAGYTIAAGIGGYVLADQLSEGELYEAIGLLQPHLVPFHTSVELGHAREEVEAYAEEVVSADPDWARSVATWHDDSDEVREARTLAEVAAMLAGRGTPWLGHHLSLEVREDLPGCVADAVEEAAANTFVALAAEGLIDEEQSALLTQSWAPGSASA